jgi:hypothetical protein
VNHAGKCFVGSVHVTAVRLRLNHLQQDLDIRSPIVLCYALAVTNDSDGYIGFAPSVSLWND